MYRSKHSDGGHLGLSIGVNGASSKKQRFWVVDAIVEIHTCKLIPAKVSMTIK